MGKMKYSEAPDNLREDQAKYLATRWEELAGLERKWIDAVFQYLFLTSSGAAIGTLTFMGATVQAKDPVMPWMVLMLVFFVASVLAVGAGKAFQYFYIRSIYASWRSNCASYYNDSLDWEEVLRRDDEKSKDSSLVQFCSWFSFFFFFAGLVVGFSQLYGGLFNGKPIEPKTTQPTAQQAGTGEKQPVITTTTDGNPSYEGQRDRTGSRNSTAETEKMNAPSKQRER